jgi:hypothetical protein
MIFFFFFAKLEILGEYIHTLARDGISAGMSGIPAAHNQLSLFSFPVTEYLS